jgi:hypothetical protein
MSTIGSMSTTPTPSAIARTHLYALHKEIGADADIALRLQLAHLAAQIEIADRLSGIEKSLDLGLKVYAEGL